MPIKHPFLPLLNSYHSRTLSRSIYLPPIWVRTYSVCFSAVGLCGLTHSPTYPALLKMTGFHLPSWLKVFCLLTHTLYSFVIGGLGWPHSFTLWTLLPITVLMFFSIWIFISENTYHLAMVMLSHFVFLFFFFLRNLHSTLQNGCAYLLSYQECMRIPPI